MNTENMLIDAIGLSVRSVNALHRADIHTVNDMLNCTEESLYRIKNLGKKSIEEIVGKIEEYKNIIEKDASLPIAGTASLIDNLDNFDEWISNEKNCQLFTRWIEGKKFRIEEIQLLSARSFNLLMLAGYVFVHQIAFLSVEELLTIPRMDVTSATEIERLTLRFVKENITDFISYAEDNNRSSLQEKSFYETVFNAQNREKLSQFVTANNLEIERMNLSNRAKSRLLTSGYHWLSEIVFMSISELMELPYMGIGSAENIVNTIKEYLYDNEARITAVITGDISAMWDDAAIEKMILDLFAEMGFAGLSLNEMITKLKLPATISVERIKNSIGQLIAAKKLEYTDYRCYRVYGRFEDYLFSCSDIDERCVDFIKKRLQGKTLEEIAVEYGLTRERVRQVVKKGIQKVKSFYTINSGMKLFDEDYYRYLYETYAFDKKDGTEWLGIPAHVWKYLDLNDVKQGTVDLQSALDDVKGLDVGLRLKIKNYLNKDKLLIDGIWIDKKRSELEQVVVRKYCSENVSFDEFCQLYNAFLEQEEIPFDDNIYYTEAIYRTRKNHLSEARYLLWKQNEQIRYYDIDGRDYSDLLDVLNLDLYENIEFSTAKFMRDLPDIMEKYDIRDQYELHNLLRKIVPEGSFHDFHCGRMPIIRFGNFDRDAAIWDILVNNAPISMTDLTNLISEEYGYEPAVIMANYMQNFSGYYHQGIYEINQKPMSEENKIILSAALDEDFYYIDEIRSIYSSHFPNADVDEINSYNLKAMGFTVYARYALRNYSTLDSFFSDLLTKEDIIDISEYRKRYAYVQIFSQKLTELKRSGQIVEFEQNYIIQSHKLEQSGITKDKIQEFCDAVYDFVKENEYFSAQSLRSSGFESELYEFGFSDWFYASLLVSDERFSYGIMFSNLILYKGKANITIKSFESSLVQKSGCVDIYDLMSELTDKYGCRVSEKSDLLYKVQDTEIFYDRILERLYANKEMYYRELEEGGF